MKTKRYYIIAPLILALLLAGALGGVWLFNRPLGPALQLDLPPAPAAVAVEPQPAAEPAAEPAAGEPQVEVASEGPKAFLSLVSNVLQQKTCGGKGLMRILVTGVTLDQDARHPGADSIYLVVVDFDRPAAGMLALLPNLWVPTPALAKQGVTETSLNLVYLTALQANANNPPHVARTKATGVLAQTILDNFGFVPDHYVTVYQEPFVEYVDLLGGIDVTVPKDLDGAPFRLSSFSAGPQHLDGRLTLDYVRIFDHPPADVFAGNYPRFERQRQVLLALLAASQKPENWSKYPELVKEVRKAVLTDLSVNQAMDLACMVELVGDQAQMLQVEPDMVTVGPAGRLLPDFEAIKELIKTLER